MERASPDIALVRWREASESCWKANKPEKERRSRLASDACCDGVDGDGGVLGDAGDLLRLGL